MQCSAAKIDRRLQASLLSSDFKEALMAIEQVYRWTEEGEHTFTSALLKGKRVGYVPGFLTITNECNMDPASYSMPVLDCTVRLASHHNLSLPEQHLVQMAFQVLPHTCVFIGIASEMLLRLHPIRIPATYQKGYVSDFFSPV
jgi:hypothetical protein